jgi:thiamine transport system substrate-binding protein
MKKIISSLFIFSTILFLSQPLTAGGAKDAAADAERAGEVVVYTYDSFMGEWGPGPEIARKFQEKTGLKITFINCGDGAQILSKALLEKAHPQSDILLGLDNNLVAKARSEKLLQDYKPAHAEEIIPANLQKALGNDYLLTPYDYSHFAIIYDTQSNIPAPESLEDLTKPEYAKKLILMDPRTSTPGLGFAAWTLGIFGTKYENYWKALKPSILTMAPGWSAGYGLFTDGEAPLVISYTTSPAYHIEYDKTDRYKALIFSEGHSEQVEGAGITNGAINLKGAKAFMDFLISDEAQNTIPLTQWMYPASKNIKLPECYIKGAPIPQKTVSAEPAALEKAVPKIMQILGQ